MLAASTPWLTGTSNTHGTGRVDDLLGGKVLALILSAQAALSGVI